MFELHHLSAQEQYDWLRRGEVSPRELVDHYLDRIDRIDGALGAFTTVTPEAARARADALGAVGRTAAPLWGLPLADKDLYDREGVPTWSGSRLSKGRTPRVSSGIAHDVDEAGAISLGKTATPEFGLTSYTETLIGPPTRNPYNLSLGPGGSSGGAAAAVAAGLVPFAPGSDGGGSIRIPAAATGLVGLKPSRGRVPSQSGIASLGGLSVGGPLARTVADAGMLLDAMVAPDSGVPRDLYALRAPSNPEGSWLGSAVRGEGRFQIGVMTTSPWDDVYDVRLDTSVLEALTVATTQLEQIGHGLDEAALAPSDYGRWFTVLWQAGAASIPAEGADLDLLEPITHWLVERGRALSARDLGQALAGLTAYERSVIRQFDAFDAVLTPTLALPSRPIGWYDSEDAEKNFEQQCLYAPFTSFVNVAGLPAISLPVHVDAAGLPVGVQLIGRPGREDVLLSIGAQLERRLKWQRRYPPQW
ncbi:amidase [Frondihabitans sp. PAMC 28766]|uniref:amidase n=1 Tax=Frondihabitans sp. PAMC 28766 TaxID=1795630 RepID=UPI00078E1136|nr:amidase [Frondihabitans sp. PAMC 28766]AMM21189.1 amidase [Frondihabitans sp. PAMC 28766]